MKKWNPDEWQGRSRKQVETQSTILYYTGIVAIIGIILYGLCETLSRLW